MECMNKFCIYQENKECTLESISLDIRGMCDDCIYTNIPEEILENEKEKILKRFDEEYDFDD